MKKHANLIILGVPLALGIYGYGITFIADHIKDLMFLRITLGLYFVFTIAFAIYFYFKKDK